MAGVTKFKNAKSKIVACRIEQEVYDILKEKYGQVSTYIIDLVYSQPEFKDRHPKNVEKEKLAEKIKELQKELKNL